jgi:hypothetical protein
VLDTGDAFTFPASTEHYFRAAPGAGRTRVLWVFSPALPDNGLARPGGPQAAADTSQEASG